LRFLAEPMAAPRPVPAYDNSAMDGYAVRAEDTRGVSRDAPAVLALIGTAAAGEATSLRLESGQAARIYTGAPLPLGANAVVRQEGATPAGANVRVFLPCEAGKNIRLRGEELAQGAGILRAGEQVNAHAAGLAASFGYKELTVGSRPRLAMLTVGDELVAPGADALDHQIYDSNAVLLEALARDAGAEVIHARRATDSEAELIAAFENGPSDLQAWVTCGGASVGDRDRVRQALTSLGAEWLFERVALKPGTPAAVALWRGRIVFVLPGNPGAATVAFDRLVRPALLRWAGVREARRTWTVPLDQARAKQPQLTQFLSARCEVSASGLVSLRIRPQGAGQIFQNVHANGWVILPAGKSELSLGEGVTFESWEHPSFESDP
jgi:molybdopterin molybdotransferase